MKSRKLTWITAIRHFCRVKRRLASSILRRCQQLMVRRFLPFATGTGVRLEPLESTLIPERTLAQQLATISTEFDMPTIRRWWPSTLLVAVVLCVLQQPGVAQEPEKEEVGPRERQEWFYLQRAYPLERTAPGARIRALKQMLHMKQQEETAAQASGTSASSASWTQIGPQPTSWCNGVCTPSSGRITAMAEDTTDTTGNTVYLGADKPQSNLRWRSNSEWRHFHEYQRRVELDFRKQ
ncbi:MAG: hypothetical protein WAQ52_00095 [Terriglobales bacterium]